MSSQTSPGPVRPMPRRGALDAVARALAHHPLVVVEGAPGSGRTTLALRLVAAGAARSVVSLSDPGTARAAHHDPAGLVASWADGTVVDDVDAVPDLLAALVAAVTSRPSPGRFVALTSPLRARGGPAPAAVAHVHRIRLFTLTQGEVRGRVGRFITAAFAGEPAAWPVEPVAVEHYLDVALTGGLPAAQDAGSGPERAARYTDHLAELLGRAGSPPERVRLRQLFDHLLIRGEPRISYDRLASELGVTAPSLAADIDRLEVLQVIVQLPSWTRFRRGRGSDGTQVFAADPAYAAHVLRLESTADVRPAQVSLLLRTLAAHELMAQNSWLRHPTQISSWRSKPANYHVDFLLEDADGAVIPVVVSASPEPGPADLAGIDAFRRRHPRAFRRGILLHPGDRVRSLGGDRWALPLSTLWTVADGDGPLDVGSLDAELDAAAAALRVLVGRVRPTDAETARRLDLVESAARAALAERLVRMASILADVGLGVSPLDVSSLPGRGDSPLPRWAVHAVSELVAGEAGSAGGGEAAAPPPASVVGGLEIRVAGDDLTRPADWVALVVGAVGTDGTVRWRSGHAVLVGAANVGHEDGADVPGGGPAATFRWIGVAGALRARCDAPFEPLADQLCAALASSLPEAMAALLPVA